MKKHLLVLLLAAGLIVPGTVLAEHSQCPMKGDSCGKADSCDKGASDCDKSGCPIIGKIMKKAHFFLANKEALGLSEQQVERIKAIKLQTQKSVIKQQADMSLFMLDLDAKLDQPKVDVEGIGAMMEQGMAAMGQSGRASVQAYADLKSILTDDQMAKAKEIWKKK